MGSFRTGGREDVPENVAPEWVSPGGCGLRASQAESLVQVPRDHGRLSLAKGAET